MRPRVFPAEDLFLRRLDRVLQSRFNEAAGIPRRKTGTQHLEQLALETASMRPRVFPAEDPHFSRSIASRFVTLQ